MGGETGGSGGTVESRYLVIIVFAGQVNPACRRVCYRGEAELPTVASALVLTSRGLGHEVGEGRWAGRDGIPIATDGGRPLRENVNTAGRRF